MSARCVAGPRGVGRQLRRSTGHNYASALMTPVCLRRIVIRNIDN
jgi:hypothetical protein